MGQAVVHFEVIGKDGDKLKSFFADLFGWDVNSDNPMNYGTVDRDANLTPEGIGIGGGIGASPDGSAGYATFYVEVPDIEASLAKADELGGTRMFGPMEVYEGLEIGLFQDPEGHVVGVVKNDT